MIRRRAAVRINRVRRFFSKPSLPHNVDGRVLVHLGCGDVAANGFVNVDLKPAPHVHYIHDVTTLPFFADNSADLVYACHVLEHFPLDQVGRALWEWRRILKPGGVLRLSVPDFDKLLAVYRQSGDVESIRQPLMGSRDGYPSHLLIWNVQFMTEILQGMGFRNIRFWDPQSVADHQFDDWANRKIRHNGSYYDISLNIEADKYLR